MDLVVVGLFWAFCGYLLIRRAILLAFAAAIALVPFGSMAAIPAQFTGGLTILPSPLVAMIAILLFLLSQPGRQFMADTAFSVRRMGLATVFLAIAAFSAVFYPRIFAGMVEVVPMRGDLGGYAGGWSRLVPTSQNISQLFYFSISTLLIFCFAFLMQFARYQQVILKAVFVGGLISVTTGVLDYASQFVDLSALLAPFRTGTYSLLVGDDVLNAKRVVGLMPEASSFGPMCVGQGIVILLWKDAFQSVRIRGACVVLAPLLFLFGFLSTSSSAYVALGATAAVLGLRAAVLLFSRRQQAPKGFWSWKLMTIIGFAVLVAAYALNPAAFSHIEALVDRMVFGKTSTSSFDERMAWNTVSLQALADTYGIGVGVGGTRASSWLVAVVSNLGIPGAVALFGFIAQAILSRKTYLGPVDAILCRGGAWALVPLLSSSALTGTSPNFGMTLALILGIHAGCGLARQAPAPGRPASAARPTQWPARSNFNQW